MKKTRLVGNYVISHEMEIPSKMSDYDYDPYHPERRFLSTYIHTVTFSDPITETDLKSISFGTFACAEIVSNLYALLYGSANFGKALTIENIIPNKNSSMTGIIILTKTSNEINFSICDFITPTISFPITNPEALIDLLSTEEMDNLFVQDNGW